MVIRAGAGEVLRLTGLKVRYLGSYTRQVFLCGGFFTLTLVIPRYLILGRRDGEPATLSLLPFFASSHQRHSRADLLLRYLWSVLPRTLFKEVPAQTGFFMVRPWRRRDWPGTCGVRCLLLRLKGRPHLRRTWRLLRCAIRKADGRDKALKRIRIRFAVLWSAALACAGEVSTESVTIA